MQNISRNLNDQNFIRNITWNKLSVVVGEKLIPKDMQF